MLQLHNLVVPKWRQCRRKPSVFCYQCLYSTISSFLVINICNQGKTLCTLCIFILLLRDAFFQGGFFFPYLFLLIVEFKTVCSMMFCSRRK